MSLKTSVIWLRVADFLRKYPPFQYFSEADLLEIAHSGRVTFHQDGEYVFRAGAPRREWIWVVQQGSVEFTDRSERVVDILGPGDILGLDGFATREAYADSVRTAGDVILYALDAERVITIVRKYSEALRFVEAYLAVHGGRDVDPGRRSWFEEPGPPVAFARRRNVVAAVGAQVAPPDLTIGEYLLRALRSGCDHITITSDGEPSSPVEAVFTAEDLAISAGRDVLGLFRAIRRAGDLEELSYLTSRGDTLAESSLGKPDDLPWCAAFWSELTFACIGQLIAFATAQLGPAPSGYSVVSTGSTARHELLGRQAPELAILCEESGSAYFSQLAQMLQSGLESCGRRPDCISIKTMSEWTRLYSGFIEDPVMQGAFIQRELFDLSHVAGSDALTCELRRYIGDALGPDNIFVPVLANDTMSSLPPLTLYGDTVIELDGDRRDGLDLRGNVIRPLIDVGRVLALLQGDLITVNTEERLRSGVAIAPQNSEVFRNAGEALRAARWYEFRHGSVVRPSVLSAYDRSVLKAAFRSVLSVLETVYSHFEGRYVA